MAETFHIDSETIDALVRSAEQMLGSADQRARLRELRDREVGVDRDAWVRLAEAGWLSVLFSEEDGGLGLGMQSAAALAQVVGKHLAPEPFAAAGVRPALALRMVPDSPLKATLLASLTKGSSVIGVAYQELDLPELPSACYLADRVSLDGCVRFVEPATADGWLVAAMDADTPLLVWVAATSPGLGCRLEHRVDGGLWGTLLFSGAKVPAEHVLARGDLVLALLARSSDGMRLVQSAELLGLACQARDVTLDYLRLRTQFGKPLASFQALQHQLVDAHLQIDLAGATLEEILSCGWESLSNQAQALYASRLKSRCADAALRVTRLAIQLHGAMGYTDECDIGLYFKRALALNASLGTAQAHRRRFFEISRRGRVAQGPIPVSGQDELEFPPGTDWETLSETEFRGTVRHFLRKNYPPTLRNMPRDAHWHQVADWYGLLARQGWVAPAWPKKYGGMELSPAKLIAFFEEMSSFGVARFISNGVQMLGPLLMKFGTDAQRLYYLPRILSNAHRWAQGYSEPNAGSDLASLSTSGKVDGEVLVINGRKIWTSHALECTHIFALVRTAKTERPSEGISFVLVDLATPGIHLRGIKNIGLDTTFAEVTFDDVRVPLTEVVGELNQGWALAKALLGHERLFSGEPSTSLGLLRQLEALAQERNLFADAAFVERFTQVQLDTLDLGALYNRFAGVVKSGRKLGADVSLLKICATETRQRAAALLCDAAAECGVIMDLQRVGDQDLNLVTPLLISLASSIAAGSNEIQRNLVARHVLNL